MLLNFFNRKTQKDSPDKLFFFLDKICNIAMIKIERGEIKSVLSILGDLESFLQKLWTLKHQNPGRFLSLISAQDLYQNACPIKMPGHLYEENSYDALCADNLKIQTLLESQNTSGKEMRGFGRFLNGFEKIWEKALHFEQEEVSKELFRILDSFLGTILSDPYNDLFVESILKEYLSIFKRMLRLENKDLVNQEIKSVLLWYQKYQLNRESQKNGFEDFTYEELLDRYCFEFIIQIISRNHNTSWELFLSLLSEKTDSLSKGSHSLRDFKNVLEKGDANPFDHVRQKEEIISRMDELENSFTTLDNFEKIREWLKSEKEILAQIEPYLDKNQAKHFREIELDIEQSLFYNWNRIKILEILDAAISFGIVRSKFFVTKTLFSYHRLYDTKRTWFLDYILPKNSFEFLSFLAKKSKMDSKYFIAEATLGYEYFHKSSILLLSVFLLRKDVQTETTNPESIHWRVTHFTALTLNTIRCFLPTMITIATEMQKEKGLEPFLGSNHIKETIIPYIERVLLTVEDELANFKIEQKLSPVKVKDLQVQIKTKFLKQAIMRSIFVFFNRLILHEEQADPNLGRVGLNVIDEKNIFLPGWENSCRAPLLDYGIKLAQSEDEFVLETIAKQCTKINFKTFMEDPNVTDPDVKRILIASDDSFYQLLEERKEFLPLWREKENKDSIPFLKGYMLIGKTKIPVFVLDSRKEERVLLLLDQKGLGEWHQWSPLNPGDDPAKRDGFLYMNFQAFSENLSLQKEYLDHPPAWLKDVGSPFDQEQYLLEHVLIHIFERFEWTPIHFSTGYSIGDYL